MTQIRLNMEIRWLVLKLTDVGGERMIPTRATYLFALAVIPSLMVWTSEAFAQQKLGYPPGRGSYDRYCSSCAPATATMEKETDPRLPR
jgi:hypothetical protein